MSVVNDNQNIQPSFEAETLYKKSYSILWVVVTKLFLSIRNFLFQIGGYDQIGNIEDGYSYIWSALDTNPALAGMPSTSPAQNTWVAG